MKKTRVVLIQFLFVCICLPSLASAKFTVSPTKIILTSEEKISSLVFTNGTNEEQKFQLIPLEEVYKNKRKTYQETQELIATPIIFELGAGQSQIIRVSPRNDELFSNQERVYKLSIKELPKIKQVSRYDYINLIMEFMIPIQIGAHK
jgi:P pilus assembly chaperone PapD